jgi:NADPH-dependent 7-cyano-7-deazaguanine reductase QueF-like protein
MKCWLGGYRAPPARYVGWRAIGIEETQPFFFGTKDWQKYDRNLDENIKIGNTHVKSFSS